MMRDHAPIQRPFMMSRNVAVCVVVVACFLAVQTPIPFRYHRFAIIADMDLDARVSTGAVSHLKIGYLVEQATLRALCWSFLGGESPWQWGVKWDSEMQLHSELTDHKGRGMELSDLCMWQNRMITVDDRTGIVYQVHLSDEGTAKLERFTTLASGDGANEKKAMKAEWCSVGADGDLYVGSTGKDWTDESNVILHTDLKWVKQLHDPTPQLETAPPMTATPHIEVVSHNWGTMYEAIRAHTGMMFPGYIVHEAARWSEKRQEWVFIPRTMSTEPYHEVLDLSRGAHIIVHAREESPEHHNPEVLNVTQLEGSMPTRGASGFSFVPSFDDDIMVLLKTEESDPDATKEGVVVRSYISVVNHQGKVLMEDQHFANIKFEGIDFF